MGFPLRIAVAGSGIGASHIEGFQELSNLFDIRILCDVNRERAAAVAENTESRTRTIKAGHS
jgi:predicted dehydrogenase